MLNNMVKYLSAFVLCIFAHIIVQAAPLSGDEQGVHLQAPADGQLQLLHVFVKGDDRDRRASNAYLTGYVPVDGPNRGVYKQRDIFERRIQGDENDDNDDNDGEDAVAHYRNRRAANPVGYAPVDGFHEGPNRGVYTQPAAFQGPTRYDSNYGDYDESLRRRPTQKPNRRQQFAGGQGPPPPSNGNKYVYQPLFKYKATHHKHNKLFVPNIFG